MAYIDHIYFEETGEGRPVIFIHCPALSHVYWRPVMDRLASVCRCIAPDLRGHGRTGLGDVPWTFRDIARDIALLTRRRHLDKPLLVGYSSGGTIALRAAIDEPNLYSGIVAISSFSECCTATMKLKVNMGLAAIKLGLLRFIGPNIISTNSAGKSHMRAMLPDAKQVNPVSLEAYFRETLRTNFTERLREIKVPVLLVGGTKDDWMHGYYRILQRELPRARALFFPNCDHRVPTRYPDSFADAVAAFLDETGPQPESPLTQPTIEYPGIQAPQLHPPS